MKSALILNLQFAERNNLTLTQIATLAACISLRTIMQAEVEAGKEWYAYNDEMMCEMYPKLFGVPKRVYKNIRVLEQLGFIELKGFGRKRYITFTELCSTYNRF